MKKIKIILSALIPAIGITPAFFTTSCGDVKVTAIEIQADATTLGFNHTIQLTANVSPSNASNKNISWSVDNSNLATITSDGKLTTKTTTGQVTVTATAQDGSGITSDLLFNIEDVKVQTITVTATPKTVNINSDVYCKATVLPLTATNRNVDWTITSGSSYASIDTNGKLSINSTPSTGDTITVTATAQDGSGTTNSTTITIDKTGDSETAEKYIHNRSFSLMAKAQSRYSSYSYGLAWGTCWILSDATPAITNDYQYYIATNWHVIKGQDVLYDTSTYKTPTIMFSDKTDSSGIDPFSGYTQFTSFSRESDDNFYFTDTPPTGYRHTGIDLFVAKANFASATGSTKAKLDNLNTLQQNKGYITQLAPTATDSKQYMCDTMYTAGYPVKNQKYATWEYHDISKTTSGMEYFSKNERAHSADNEYDLVDISPQYRFANYVEPTWMDGGASGSMLIGQFDGTYKVIGIYWGGSVDDAYNPTKFWPSYSIFNSSYGNFLSKYL